LKKEMESYEPDSAKKFEMEGPMRIQRFWGQSHQSNKTLLVRKRKRMRKRKRKETRNLSLSSSLQDMIDLPHPLDAL